MKKSYWVYILASKRNGPLYSGVTDWLKKRVWQHKQELVEGFTKKYKVHMLVHYEEFIDPTEAILREKRIKRWKRKWKIKLIEEINPEWKDLYNDI